MKKLITKSDCKKKIEARALLCGKHIAETGATVRATAELFGYSKSTVHKDINDRLLYINNKLRRKAKKQLLKNLAERHIRGGMANKKRYEEQGK
jgi:putative DeoR family transcriptional regulator (stage III sporulation protein D)